MGGWRRHATPADTPAPGGGRADKNENEANDDEDDVRHVRAVLLLSGLPWNELDDGVQQVRLKLLEEQARPDRPAIRDRRAWLAAVASRVAIDFHRDQAKQTGLRQRLAARWLHRPPADHPQEHRTLALTVADELERLPEAHRQALVLRYYADLPVPDIARLLDIPQGTVKSRLHHAVAALRTQLRNTEAI